MLAIFTRIVIFLAILVVIGQLIPDPFVAQMDSAVQYFAQNICALNLFVNAQTLLNALTIFLGVFVGAVLFILCFYFIKFTGGVQK